jgi:hypothetical protein
VSPPAGRGGAPRPAPGLLLPLLFASLLALPFFWRLEAEEFHGDESHWISSGQQALALLAAGDASSPQWHEEFYFYSQPQLGKVLIGLALAGAGIAGPTAIYDYDWQLRPAENRAAGRVPPPPAVLAGRTAGAFAGWAACLALWGLGAAFGAPLAGAAGALLLASQPLWLANARRAGLDAPALALGLLAALVAVLALRRWRAAGAGPGAGGVAGVLAAGVLAGLAVGTKYVSLLALPAATVTLVAAGASAVRARRSRGVLLGALLGSAVLAGLTFWATNPALYRDPAGGLRVSLDFLTVQAEGMRWQSPVFRYRPLVAVEVLDRTVWPLGFPAVTDQTLPEPLSPGSYGTPVVAIAALAGLGYLFRPGTRRPALLSAAVWTALVYLALVWSVPIWWERWHLPLVPPLCLLAGLGLAALARGRARVALVPAAAQYVAALAMGPSYLGNGFGALLGTPAGVAAHVLAATWLLVHFWAQAKTRTEARSGAGVLARTEINWRQRWQTALLRGERGASDRPVTGSCASASSAPAGSRRARTSPATRIPRESSSSPPAT